MTNENGVVIWFTETEVQSVYDALDATLDLLAAIGVLARKGKYEPLRTAFDKFQKAVDSEEGTGA